MWKVRIFNQNNIDERRTHTLILSSLRWDWSHCADTAGSVAFFWGSILSVSIEQLWIAEEIGLKGCAKRSSSSAADAASTRRVEEKEEEEEEEEESGKQE